MKPIRMTRAALAFFLTVASGSAAKFATAESGDHARWRPVFDAQFRGCEDSGACRFWIDARDADPEGLYRVRPDGVIWIVDEEHTARAVRDRLNALLSSMIHQHKRIELHGMRTLGDQTHAARVSVNGADLADDPILAQLARTATPAPR